jgi:autotransporter-associated beta strand protein
VIGNTGSLAKLSFTFSGWNTAPDGSGTTYNSGDPLVINADTTLYARWLPGPDFVWSNAAQTGNWNFVDTNWNGAIWSNSASHHAIFNSVGGSVYLDSGILAGAVNFGNVTSNTPNVYLLGGDLTASSWTIQGSGNNGGTYGSNPIVFVDSSVSISGNAAVGRANLIISGGAFTADRIISAPASADWGRLVVSGSAVVTATNGVDGSVNTGATFAIDLNGGELRAPSIRVADRQQGTNNNAWLTFNGGKLTVIGGDNADYITTYGGGQNTFIASGGAVIDTNGFHIGIKANLVNAGGAGGLIKQGTGTLTLEGLNNYVGDTTVDAGTLVLADGAQMTFVVSEIPSANRVTGGGAAVFNGDFLIDTSAVTGTNGFIWSLVDRATLTGESFDPVTFSVVGFTDANDDGIWTMSDAKGDWFFDESTGELTLDVGNDYDDWGAAYGLAQGSESGDLDGDGLSNQQEYAFGLIPNSGASVNAIAVGLDKASGSFSYTRRQQTITGLTYSVWYSTDLTNWNQDTGAVQGTPVLNGQVETVPVTLTNNLLSNTKLFIQVRAQ